MRVVFAGTPEFSVAALKALDQSPNHTVCAVYTQPDRPSGRGRKITPSAVKQCAQTLGYPIFQPESLNTGAAAQTLASHSADVMVVVAYGIILPQSVIDIPLHGCINIHASLLPRWRGAAPIQRAILAGDSHTGVSIMQIDSGLDSGDVLLKKRIPIGINDTSQKLHHSLAKLGADALMEALKQVKNNTLTPAVQDPLQALHADKIHKREARLDWRQSALELHQRIRALVPWPVAECRWNDRRLRIWGSALCATTTSATPGAVVSASATGVKVATGNGVLRLLNMQLPGGKALTAEQFVNAYQLSGARFD